MEIDRREFLKLLGVSTVATVVGALGAYSLFSVPDNVFNRALNGPHIETWKNSICSMCPGGCGIRVRLIDNIPVKITGNPLYPINRGAICPMAEAGIEMLFHPKRIKQPMKRVSKQGDNQWQAISWDEALEMLSSRLQQLRANDTAEKLVTIMHDNNDLTTDLTQQFMSSFGSPNFLCLSDKDKFSLPTKITQGLQQPPAYDLVNTNFILNFGNDFLDKSPSPVRFNQHYANFRTRPDNVKTQIVHLSSYMSRSAANSSEWVSIKPGTTAAMALAIAHIMIKDQTYDQQFIKNHGFGFLNWKDSQGEWHTGFKTLVMEDYSPKKVAGITGVPANKILKLARDFASAQPALAIAGGQDAEATNSFYNLWAVYCLNALKGNLGKQGGLLFQPEMNEEFLFQQHSNFNSNEKPNRVKNKIGTVFSLKFDGITLDCCEQLIATVLENHSEPIDTLLLYNVNPIYESNDQKQLKKTLRKIPFIVSCTSFFDETTEYADLILPDHSFLEKWEGSRNIPTIEFSHMGIQQPVIETFYDTNQFGDILLKLSKLMGGDMQETLPWDNYKSFVQVYAQNIFKSGKGTIVSESIDLSWIEFLKKRGWRAFEYSTFDEFWDVLLEKGGWWDPSYFQEGIDKIFKTESGKFEFYSQTLRKEISKLAVDGNPVLEKIKSINPVWENDILNDLIYLPHFEELRFSKENSSYPFHFLSFPLLINSGNNAGYLGLLQELAGLHSREFWNPWVEINPKTARRLGINEGDYVNVISPSGQIALKVKILPTVMPEIVMMPFIRFDELSGANPREIFTAENDLICGIPSFISTKVKIEKIQNKNIA